MVEPCTTKPSMASSSTDSDKKRLVEVAPPLESTIHGEAASGGVEETSNSIVEAIAGSEEAQRATVATRGHGEEVTRTGLAQEPSKTLDPDQVSQVSAIPSTSSSLNVVIDPPASSSSLIDVGLVVVTDLGGDDGGDGGLSSGGGDGGLGSMGIVGRDMDDVGVLGSSVGSMGSGVGVVGGDGGVGGMMMS